jgi:hypothetical protein
MQPADRRIPWVFAPPTIARPVSHVCTDEQFREPEYQRLCAIHETHPNFHRKQWQFLYIHSVLEKLGMLAPGRRLLGFGTGTEPLPSIFASFGADVLATDAPMDTDEAQAGAARRSTAATSRTCSSRTRCRARPLTRMYPSRRPT